MKGKRKKPKRRFVKDVGMRVVVSKKIRKIKAITPTDRINPLYRKYGRQMLKAASRVLRNHGVHLTPNQVEWHFVTPHGNVPNNIGQFERKLNKAIKGLVKDKSR